MSPRYAVIGPLREPAIRSGVHHGTCSHVAPDACSRCDGTGDDEWQERRAHRAPTGKPMSTVELWRLVEACRPTTPTDERHGGAA